MIMSLVPSSNLILISDIVAGILRTTLFYLIIKKTRMVSIKGKVNLKNIRQQTKVFKQVKMKTDTYKMSLTGWSTIIFQIKLQLCIIWLTTCRRPLLIRRVVPKIFRKKLKQNQQLQNYLKLIHSLTVLALNQLQNPIFSHKIQQKENTKHYRSKQGKRIKL